MADKKKSWFSKLFSKGENDAPAVSDVVPMSPHSAQEMAMAAEASGDWKPDQVVLEDYIVRGELGRGGLGVVYKVEHKDSPGLFFAVKRVKVADERHRRDFIDELKTWIDLPDHPNLCACRFFRTVGDQIVIFSEYVDGGSLSDWIRQGRFHSLESILDAAIQFAWGLHAAHEWDLVHQDVKPANVLMTKDGIAKVADFGLSSGKAQIEEANLNTTEPGPQIEIQDASGQSLKVSCRGMTPTYCSPEQATGKPLSRKTDIWSYGVSVLEMFAGGVFWLNGLVADKALAEYLTGGLQKEGLPQMPPAIADILRRCLQPDPAERWTNLLGVAHVLITAFRKISGHDYPRPTPVFLRASEQNKFEHDRKISGYNDPREYLEKALNEAGHDPREAQAIISAQGVSRKAKVIADIVVFEEARQILKSLVQAGRHDLETILANLCFNEASAHETVDDYPGAFLLYCPGSA
jgi:serine/threonine protein kinase